MKKISFMRILTNIILVIDKILPDKVMKKIINFGIERYIKKYANLEVVNKERLDLIGSPVIFICNHLSNADGLILNKVLKNNDVTFIMGVKLTRDPMTNLGCRIVKTIQITPSSPDRGAISNLVNHVKNGHNILIFPEGTRSRDGKMIPAKKGIYLIAKLCNVPIVPISIYGSEKFMPIDKEGNMNNETFNESNVVVTIGEKIDIPKKESTESKEEFEQRFINTLMKKIANMLPEEYRGVYGDEQGDKDYNR